ncbi:peroxisomal assembly protein [Blyttiomyces sp. JEL0837]|nr:peroxisomal assembly protein [Blyttiomyces sp. JEL0837]
MLVSVVVDLIDSDTSVATPAITISPAEDIHISTDVIRQRDDVHVSEAIWNDLIALGAVQAPKAQNRSNVDQANEAEIYIAFTVGGSKHGTILNERVIISKCKRRKRQVRISSEVSGLDEEYALFLSNRFLKNNGIDPSNVDEAIDIRPASLISLDEVVFSFRHASSQISQDEIAQVLSESGEVIRQGSQYQVSYLGQSIQIKVTSCLPVQQGLLSATSRVIMARFPERLDGFDANDTPTSLSGYSRHDFDQFLSSALVWGDTSSAAGLHFLPLGKDEDFNRLRMSLQTPVTECFASLASKFPPAAKSMDGVSIEATGMTIFAHPTLLARIGVFQGDKMLQLSSSSSSLPNIPSAESVTIARVAGPTTNDRVLLDAALDGLQKWFEASTRYLANGDLIPIAIDAEQVWLEKNIKTSGNAAGNFDSDRPHRDLRIAYFKVTEIVGPEPENLQISGSFRINPSETRILQTGVVTSFCPPDIQTYCEIPVLSNVEVLSKSGNDESDQVGMSKVLADCLESWQKEPCDTLLGVIALADDIEKVSNPLQSLFRHEVQVESPSEAVRKYVLVQLTQGINLSPDVNLDYVALQTAGLVARDLVALISRANRCALDRIAKNSNGRLTARSAAEQNLLDAGVIISSSDIDQALSYAKASHSDNIGAPKIPKVTWDDVGGLSHVRESIVDTIQLPLERPELFANGMKKRSGILLYGPPGTGKTLVAKAVATTFSLNFMSVKGPELLNMYIGESEANVRRIFQRARDAKPCVIFFDELDSVAPKRGEKGDSGGVMDRIVSQILAELDGVSGGSGGDVFVIGATNRPDLLDPALLRPGRFDKLLYLGVSDNHERQANIMEALTRKFVLSPSLSLIRVAQACPMNLTGADLYALCSDAMLKAIIRTIDGIETKIKTINSDPNRTEITVPQYLENVASQQEKQVVVSEEDFMKALAELKPSVSAEDLAHYHDVQKKFSSG